MADAEKSNRRKITLDTAAGTLVFAEHGWTADIKEILSYEVYEDLPEIGKALVMHGLKQKLSDSTAGMKDASSEEKAKVVKNVFEHLAKGEWTVRGEGGGGTASFKAKASQQILSGNATAEQIQMIVLMGILKQAEVDALIQIRDAEPAEAEPTAEPQE